MTVRPTKVPGIPKPPASAGPELRRYLESLAEAVEIRLGRKGDPRDRAVTLRELIESGLARELRATPFDPNNVGGPGLGFVADNPVPETGVPPQPTGFTAAGAYSVINLAWDFPLYTGPNHAHTEIYSYPSDNLASALSQGVIGVVSGRAYTDPVGSNVTRYYWIRHVNENGTVGPWNNGSGTVATTAPDVDHLLNVLTGAVTESELATTLGDRIDLIDATASVTGSVAYQVAQEATARASAIAAETSARVAAIDAIFTNIPIHDPAADYSADQIVRVSNSNSKLYIAIQAVAGSANIALTNTSYWKLYGDYDSLKSSTDSSAAAITQINTVSSSSTSAAAQAIDALETTVNDSSSGVAATSTALGGLTTRVTTAEGSITTNASDISALESTVNNSSTGVAATSTALGALTTRVTTAEGGITTNASDITALENTVNDSSTGVAATSTALGALTTRVTTAEGSITANASDITALENTVNDSSTGVAATSTALGALTTRVTTAEGNITTNASDITALETTVNNPTTGVAATATALSSLTSTVTSQGNSITANANSTSQISARLNDINDTGSGGAVTVEEAYTATATNTSDVTSLKGQYTVKIDANGAVAGFGLASTSTSLGTNESEFYVNADRFAIMRGGSNTAAATAPFVVQATATTINGQSVPAGVYMADAFIKNGSIEAAKIGSLNADVINAGTIDATHIGTNTIDASKLVIDGSSLTSTVVNGVPTLQLGSVNVNQLTGNSISATIMSGTTVYANKLTGDVNKLLPFRSTTPINVKGNTASGGGTVQVISKQLPATTHTSVGHKPFASVTGWYDSTANKTYSFKLYMQDTVGTASSIGSPTLSSSTSGNYYMTFSGNKTGQVVAGATLTASGKSHTVSSVQYITGSNTTSIVYVIVSGQPFTTSDTISTASSSGWVLVGETRFKANTNLYAQFALSGSLAQATLGAVNMKLEVTRTGASGVNDNDTSTTPDVIYEVSGFMMGAR